MVETLLIAVKRVCQLLPPAGVLMGALVAAGGCRNADWAERRLALRSEGMAHTVAATAKREGWRPRRLAYTLDKIERGVGRRVELSRANVDEIRLYQQREWQTWLERQPAYRKAARRVLGGKPDRIERNAITLFF